MSFSYKFFAGSECRAGWSGWYGKVYMGVCGLLWWLFC